MASRSTITLRPIIGRPSSSNSRLWSKSRFAMPWPHTRHMKRPLNCPPEKCIMSSLCKESFSEGRMNSWINTSSWLHIKCFSHTLQSIQSPLVFPRNSLSTFTSSLIFVTSRGSSSLDLATLRTASNTFMCGHVFSSTGSGASARIFCTR